MEALVGAFSMIVKTDGSFAALVLMMMMKTESLHGTTSPAAATAERRR